MTLDSIRDRIGGLKHRVEDLEAENARLRVESDDLRGQLMAMEARAQEFEMAYQDQKDIAEKLRSELLTERIRANGTS